MKKIIALALVILTLSLPLASCKTAIKMTDEEAVTILEDLIPKSQELNKIFWTTDIPLLDENAEAVSAVTTAQYYEVAEDFPYRSVAELKAAAEAVFSTDYLEDVYALAFDGYEYSDDETTYTLNPRFKDNSEGILCFDITNTTNYPLNTVIDISSAKVESTTYALVTISLDCTISGNASQIKITLYNQNGEWRLDSPTY